MVMGTEVLLTKVEVVVVVAGSEGLTELLKLKEALLVGRDVLLV